MKKRILIFAAMTLVSTSAFPAKTESDLSKIEAACNKIVKYGIPCYYDLVEDDKFGLLGDNCQIYNRHVNRLDEVLDKINRGPHPKEIMAAINRIQFVKDAAKVINRISLRMEYILSNQ